MRRGAFLDLIIIKEGTEGIIGNVGFKGSLGYGSQDEGVQDPEVREESENQVL